jgi:thiamine-monophosphate kinase
VGWRDDLTALAAGIAEATRSARAPIVGGDVTDGNRLALAITVLGHAKRPLSRAGARPGDTLYVTGALGGPGAALAAWESGAAPRAADRARFVRPAARIAAGEWLVTHGATAAIDLSDGLAGDVAHLAHASGVHCVLDLDAIPCVPDADVGAALASGEEYELLVAAPALDTQAFTDATGLALTAIGRVDPASGRANVSAERAGRPVLLPRSHDHFAR